MATDEAAYMAPRHTNLCPVAPYFAYFAFFARSTFTAPVARSLAVVAGLTGLFRLFRFFRITTARTGAPFKGLPRPRWMNRGDVQTNANVRI